MTKRLSVAIELLRLERAFNKCSEKLEKNAGIELYGLKDFPSFDFELLAFDLIGLDEENIKTFNKHNLNWIDHSWDTWKGTPQSFLLKTYSWIFNNGIVLNNEEEI